MLHHPSYTFCNVVLHFWFCKLFTSYHFIFTFYDILVLVTSVFKMRKPKQKSTSFLVTPRVLRHFLPFQVHLPQAALGIQHRKLHSSRGSYQVTLRDPKRTRKWINDEPRSTDQFWWPWISHFPVFFNHRWFQRVRKRSSSSSPSNNKLASKCNSNSGLSGISTYC